MRCVINATPRPLYPRERPGTHCIGGWVGPRAGLDGCGKSRPPPGIRSPDRPARRESLYRLSYSGPFVGKGGVNILDSTGLVRGTWGVKACVMGHIPRMASNRLELVSWNQVALATSWLQEFNFLLWVISRCTNIVNCKSGKLVMAVEIKNKCHVGADKKYSDLPSTLLEI